MIVELTTDKGQPIGISADAIKCVTRANPNVLTGAMVLIRENVSLPVSEGYSTVMAKWREALGGSRR